MPNLSTEQQLNDIQQLLQQGCYQDAKTQLTEAIQQQPAQPQLKYMAAVCCRYLNDYQGAQRYLDDIKLASGDRGRTYQEQAYLYLAQQQPQQALKAFDTACQLNAALIPAWKAQFSLSQQLGLAAKAKHIHQQLSFLTQQPKAVIAVMDLIAQGKLVKAETLCRKFLQQNPTHVEAMRLLAEIGTKLGEMADAEFLLESAVALAPTHIGVRVDYIQLLRKYHRYQQALENAQALFEVAPDNPQVKSVYAIEKMQMADYAGAVKLFEEVLDQIGQDPITLTSRGHALKTWGQQQQAIASYEAALKVAPGHGEAWHALANLKTYQFSEQQIAQMKTQEQDIDLGPMHKIQLNFALGKAFEDTKAYEQAFKFYQAGNQIKREHSAYDAEQMHDEFERQKQFFTPALVSEKSRLGCQAPDPIFIVGLPRAGSTLLEQILSSHSQVDGTLELPNILSMAQSLRKKGYPDQLSDFSEQQLQNLGQQFLSETQVHRQAAPYFIDKMPNNFRHIGLIKLILPNAKIIDARRDAMACCFSGYKQLFAEGQEFSYSLNDIGRYYQDYVALMDYWQQVFPKQILLVQYEQVVADLENQVKRLLDYCGLPFEESCLNFHQTERAVRTASSEQVRQPLYQSGLEQWKHFEPYLNELKQVIA